MLMLDLLTNTWQHPGSLKEKPWWLRLRQRWLRSDQVFYLRVMWYPKVIYLVPQMLAKYCVITKLSLGHVNKFEIKIEKISLHGSHFSDNPEFGHFTSLFCRGWERNVPRMITCAQSLFSSLILVILPLLSSCSEIHQGTGASFKF